MGTGIPVPPVIPEGSKAFTICVPDDPFFYGVVMGLLKTATFKYYWAGTEEQVAAVTDRMLEMYYGYQDQVGCMDCDQIADCIDNDEATQAALARAIAGSNAIQQALAQQFDPSKRGVEVPGWYTAQNAAKGNPTCDPDIAFGHIRDGLVERSFQRVIDVLEQIEFVTDNQEMLAQLVNAIPVVGALFDVVPVTDWILWFDNVRAWMRDAFEAGDTVDLRDTVACDLFCLWQIDCSLSIQQIADYYQDKTLELVPSWSNAWESMNSLVSALAGS